VQHVSCDFRHSWFPGLAFLGCNTPFVVGDAGMAAPGGCDCSASGVSHGLSDGAERTRCPGCLATGHKGCDMAVGAVSVE
jgi:hypothetical protein